MTKRTDKEHTDSVTKSSEKPKNKGGRPPGKWTEEQKFNRDARKRVRTLTSIAEAHIQSAMEDIDAAKAVMQIIKTTHDIHSSLFGDKKPSIAVQINNESGKTNADEVVKILKKKHKDL